MIISDAHRFVFVHIPKCGGTAIRGQLRSYDSYEGRFSQKNVHPALGHIDHSHLPLATLREHFPEEFEKLCAYRSFAVVRDPHTRFLSATLQHLQEFEKISHESFRPDWVAARVFAIMDRLSSGEAVGPQFVHFTAQSVFVDLEKHRIVRELFAFENRAPLVSFLQKEIGIAADLGGHVNRSPVPDPAPLEAVRRTIGPGYRRVVSPRIRNRINRALGAARIINTSDALYQRVLEKIDIGAFIRSHYADDIALHASLFERETSTP